jgi:hypothetical protein
MRSYIYEYIYPDSMDKPGMFIIYEETIAGWIERTRETTELTLRFNITIYNAFGKRIWWFNHDPDQKARRDHFSEKFELAARIEECKTPDGKIWYTMWQRDCDMCEGTDGPYQMEANVFVWQKMVNRDQRGAEGPMSHSILTAAEAEEFKPESRDLALEAFEDGHPHMVSTVRFETN